MLELEPMVKARILVSQGDREGVISSLYSFGAIQPMESKILSQDSPLSYFRDVSEALVKLRAMQNLLKLRENREIGSAKELGALLSEYSSLDFKKAQELSDEVSVKTAEVSGLKQKEEHLLHFSSLEISPKNLYERKGIKFAFIKLRPKVLGKAIELISRNKVDAVKSSCSGNDYLLLAGNEREVEKTLASLSSHVLASIPIPKVESGSFKQELEYVISERKRIETELSYVTDSLEDFKKKNERKISSLISGLEHYSQRAQLPLLFGKSKNLVMIEGWIPSKKKEGMENALKQVTGSKCIIEFSKPTHEDSPPSKLKNPKLVKPFEFMLEFFSLPKYGHIDPTILVAITFPFFFGMILGDIGYGVLALALALLVKAKAGKNKLLSQLGGIMTASAISTIVFGFIFGEFFGFDKIGPFKLHPLISRVEPSGLQALIGLSILVGFIHVATGFILGIMEGMKHGEKKHALAKASWLLLEFSIVGAVYSYANLSFFSLLAPMVMLLPKTIWALLLLASVIALYLLEGLNAVFEVPGVFVNLFSYLRLMALGVSGVIIAQIIDNIPLRLNSLDPSSIFGFLLFFLVFTIFHLLALVLGLFESSIQSLRLHYVELFSKFYHGGGIPFAPLSGEDVES